MGGSGQIGQVLQATYRIERLVGEGGMGSVFEASHQRLSRRFAIKILNTEVADHPEALARFQQEAEIASSLGHPNILEVIDLNYTPEGAPYIVMELLEGETLQARIERLKPLDLSLVSSIFRQAASALQAVHDKGIIHRDLKPQNIFLCARDGRDDFVKVVDFGVSKILGSRGALTKTHALLGTPFYMAPEQAEERTTEVDHRSDIYAMGTLLYEMFAGNPPFTGDSIPAVLYRIVAKDPPMLSALRPDLPAAVSEVIAKALSKKQQDRYSSMSAFWDAFSSAVERGASSSSEPATRRRTQIQPANLVGQRIGNYVVKAMLGEGGMGAVYLAEHPEIERKVAVKVLASHLIQNPMASERFVSEAKAVSRIDHLNIVDIYDFGHLEDGRLYYVMEKLDGRELLAVMESEGKMTAAQLFPYLEQICGALQAAHDQGIIHRDLKPENIFVLNKQPLTLKVLDFGIAKLLESSQGQARPGLTTTGMVMGTPLVIAPEQAAGRPEQICPRTDLYSLGVILYWMLAGKPPFWDETVALLLGKHIQAPPPPLREAEPSVPEAVARLVEQCLEKDPADRPSSAAALFGAFAAALAASAPQAAVDQSDIPTEEVTVAAPAAAPPGAAGPARQKTTLGSAAGEVTAGISSQLRRRPRLLLMGAGGAVVLAIATVFLLSTLRGDSDPGRIASSPATVIPAAASAPESSPLKAATPTATAAADANSDEKMHTITIKANGEATCRLRVGSGAARARPVPCTFHARAGETIHLEVVRSGYRAYSTSWTLDDDRAIALAVQRKSKRIVLAASAADDAARPRAARPDQAKPPRKQAGAIRTTPKARPRSTASGREPDWEDPFKNIRKAPPKPRTPAEPKPKKKKAIPKEVGEGTIPLPD